MNANLKHVERNAHKKDGAILQPIAKKEPVASVKKTAVEEVKKDPKQEFKMNTYYLVPITLQLTFTCRNSMEKR